MRCPAELTRKLSPEKDLFHNANLALFLVIGLDTRALGLLKGAYS